MKLYTEARSPYGRKVRMLLREIGLASEVTEIAVEGPLDPAVAALNPVIRVPVLVRADGRALYDSRVITRYLDELAGGGFYPAGRLWDVLSQEAAIEGIIQSANAADGLEGAQKARITNALDMFEHDWAEIAGRSWDMSLIGMACALAHLDDRHGACGWRDGRPRLASWFAGVESRPSFVATAYPA